MSTTSYLQAVRTEILALAEDVHQVATDMDNHGLLDCCCSDDRIAEIEADFGPCTGRPGTMVFRSPLVTCGEDCNDAWLEREVDEMLANALPGSFVEVCDTTCPCGDIGVFRIEVTESHSIAKSYCDFESPFAKKAAPGESTWEELTYGDILSGDVSYGEMAGTCLHRLGKAMDLGEETPIKIGVFVEAGEEA